MTTGKYCCWFHPSHDYSPKTLDDRCPQCDRDFGFPLKHAPSQLRQYRDIVPLDRGFYSATFKAKVGALGREVVLKLVPISVYEFFGKNFEEECRRHKQIADGTEHLVDIFDFGEEDVRFGHDTLRCHFAELQKVNGIQLDAYLSQPGRCTGHIVSQLAIDLFRLLRELDNRRAYHNDLHARNILVEDLAVESTRAEAVVPNVRAVAIDLGSLEAKSLSDTSRKNDPTPERLGDLHVVVRHLLTFREHLLRHPDQTVDTDYRIALLLDEVAHELAPDALTQRTPDYLDIVHRIEQHTKDVASPWQEPLGLKRFTESYNAQSLHPWFVPRLLVDPDGKWLRAVSTTGPQLITGIRGCGKTMLLRALHIHARLSQFEPDTAPAPAEPLAASLRRDGFVGLYVSATRLLDVLGRRSDDLQQPFARLFLAYGREALRAARHLRERTTGVVRSRYWRHLAEVVAAYVADADVARLSISDDRFERETQAMLVSLERGEASHSLQANPTIAFQELAEAIRQIASCWSESTVLFLLDDVSTRHVNLTSVSHLFGTLFFQSPHCAFKMTTEVQTFEQILRSPGLIEKARPGRDYESFDLGAEVNRRLRYQHGSAFLAEILQHRANQLKDHPSASPQKLLGDCSLEDIARQIVRTGSTSRQRKETYHGIRALCALCVGDIGDALMLYEAMLRGGWDGGIPIPKSIQSGCFQEYCSRRLYHLNRQNRDFKDFALGFAQASHELLIRSGRDPNGRRGRLRQYTTLLVNLSTGDTAAQFDRIRELVDAGVFVMEGGTEAPRTKSRGDDPIQQFNLTFRKLFGVSSYIGLAASDRFEMSGERLQEWLRSPAEGKRILMEGLGGELSATERYADAACDSWGPDDKSQSTSADHQRLPFDGKDAKKEETEEGADTGSSEAVEWQRVPTVAVVRKNELEDAGILSVVVGLGFERRTLTSVKRVLEVCAPGYALMIRYPVPGFSASIRRAVRQNVEAVNEISYEETIDLPSGPVLVDVTGLSKGLLFRVVRSILMRDGEVYIAHTEAGTHYPLNADIDLVLEGRNDSPYETLEAAGDLWSGERKPYLFDRLLQTQSDESRGRLLCAAASPKHERLLSLLEIRPFDEVDIVVPATESPRSKLARLAATVATGGLEASSIETIDSDDVVEQLTFLVNRFRRYYLGGGFNVELALTGSKLHAVACAALASAYRVSEVWYVRPQSFDPGRFTRGTRSTKFLHLELPGQSFSDT